MIKVGDKVIVTGMEHVSTAAVVAVCDVGGETWVGISISQEAQPFFTRMDRIRVGGPPDRIYISPIEDNGRWIRDPMGPWSEGYIRESLRWTDARIPPIAVGEYLVATYAGGGGDRMLRPEWQFGMAFWRADGKWACTKWRSDRLLYGKILQKSWEVMLYIKVPIPPVLATESGK